MNELFTMKYRGVEQSVARRAHNPKVTGSSPVPATNADVAQSAERILGKDKVTGSIPVISSIGGIAQKRFIPAVSAVQICVPPPLEINAPANGGLFD